MAQVVEQGHDDEGIAEEGGQHGRTGRGVVLLHAHDVAGDGGEVAAGGQAHAAEQVEADPHAPGLVVVEVGNSAYALREADPGNDQADGQQGVVDDVSRRELKELLHIEEMIFSRDGDLM